MGASSESGGVEAAPVPSSLSSSSMGGGRRRCFIDDCGEVVPESSGEVGMMRDWRLSLLKVCFEGVFC